VLFVGGRQPRGGNQFHGPKLDQRIFCKVAGRGVGKKERAMTILRWALLFFLVSIVAGLLGFTEYRSLQPISPDSCSTSSP